jgi:hypothetical protein
MRGPFHLFVFPLGSFSPQSAQSLWIDYLHLKNFDLIHRSSRARYTLSPISFLRIDLIYFMCIFVVVVTSLLGFWRDY